MNSYDKIANNFNTTFETQFQNKIDTAMTSVQAEKQQLTAQIKTTLALPTVEIKDREYLETKIKGLIERTTNVLDIIDNDLNSKNPDGSAGITPQAKAFMLKVYADVCNAVSIQLRELRELSKMNMGIDMVNAEQSMKANEEQQLIDKAKDKKYILSGSDIAELIDAARSTSQMNSIYASFKIIGEQ
jgi:multidrug efflux pump subunit AcrB